MARKDDVLALLHHFCHELRQPLSELEATAYYLDMVMESADPALRRRMEQMRSLVHQAAWLASDACCFHGVEAETQDAADLNGFVEEVCGRLALHEESAVELHLARPAARVRIARTVVARLLRHVLEFLRDVAQCPAQPTLETRPVEGGAQIEIRCQVSKPAPEMIALLDPPSVSGGLRRCAAGLGLGLEIWGSGDAIRIALTFPASQHEVEESRISDVVESHSSGS